MKAINKTYKDACIHSFVRLLIYQGSAGALSTVDIHRIYQEGQGVTPEILLVVFAFIFCAGAATVYAMLFIFHLFSWLYALVQRPKVKNVA